MKPEMEERYNGVNRLDSPSEVIKKELLSWKGVTAHDHNFASTIFYVNGSELGHLHGDAIADLQFPKKLGKKLVSDGKVSPHQLIPKSEWVSHEIKNSNDVQAVIELFPLRRRSPYSTCVSDKLTWRSYLKKSF